MTKRYKYKRQPVRENVPVKSAAAQVKEAIKAFSVSAMHLFRKAYSWKFKKHDSEQVRKAYDVWKRAKKVVDWMREYLEHLIATGAKTLPT